MNTMSRFFVIELSIKFMLELTLSIMSSTIIIPETMMQKCGTRLANLFIIEPPSLIVRLANIQYIAALAASLIRNVDHPVSEQHH